VKISDFIFQFPVGISSKRHGICRVRVFITTDEYPVVLLTDLGSKNVGPSVTNAIESIVKALVDRGHVPQYSRFIEHYEVEDRGGASFDAVTITPGRATSWETLHAETVARTLGFDLSELDRPTLSEPRLRNEVERQRHLLEPHVDIPYAESTRVIQRRLEIESTMLSRAQVEAVIESEAGESELQEILRSDLSLLGEVYAALPEEYICFSEYPIADGFVDFVVFTGRSCMDVFLIEVKGADFNLVNSDSYEGFSAKINQAVDQIRRRYRAIYESLAQSRKSFHTTRAVAESGKAIYRSFLGARTPLGVDLNKDIHVYAVVIGGQTRNDLKESWQRQDYQRHFTPPIKVESWNSWARKLQRQ